MYWKEYYLDVILTRTSDKHIKISKYENRISSSRVPNYNSLHSFKQILSIISVSRDN